MDFTQWLAEPENLDLLAEAIGIELTDAKTEVGVGPFRVDILARDAVTEQFVVIENQLEPTNHDHLGKIITYAAGHDAETVVWVVKEVRDEHRSAVEWLNEHTTADVNFFLLVARAWRIGGSVPAPDFEVVVRPNDWVRAQKQASDASSPRFVPEIAAFYEKVRTLGIERAKNIRRWRAASGKRWYDVAIDSRLANVVMRVTTQEGRVSVELYIGDSPAAFAMLREEAELIEAELGLELDWNEKPGRKARRIIASRAGAFDDATESDELAMWMVDTADAFARVFGPRLRGAAISNLPEAD